MKRLLRFTLSIIIFASVYSIIPNDCSAQGWEQLATLSNAPNIPAMAAANGKIYVMSGTGSGTAVTHEYDPATDTWSNKAPIPQSTFWSTASEVGGKIYVMGGGQAYPGKTYNYIYDPATDSWTKGADLLTGRMYHSAAVANGKIYLMGGQNGDGTSEWYFDEYDPAADSWQRKAQILHNSAWYSGAVGVGSKVYRIAGGGSNPTLTKDYFDEYDVVTDTWTALTPFPIKLHAPAAVNLNGNIVVAGGYTNSVSIDSIYLHTPGTEGWGQTFIRLPEPRTYHKAAVIGSYLYIYGGQGNDLDLKGTLIRYNFGTPVYEETDKNITDYKIFPNPSHGDFCISGLGSGLAEISIYDVIGQEIYSSEGYPDDSGRLFISLNNKSDGIYFVRIIANSKTTVMKLITKY